MIPKGGKLWAILIGAGLITLLSSVPIVSLVNCCCCAGILFGGFFAVYTYRKDLPPGSPAIEVSEALFIGLLSGLGGAVGAGLFSAVSILVFGPPDAELIGSILSETMEKMGGNAAMYQDAIDDALSMIQGTSPWLIMLMFLFDLFLFPIFAMLGGLLAYGIFKNKPLPGMDQFGKL